MDRISGSGNKLDTQYFYGVYIFVNVQIDLRRQSLRAIEKIGTSVCTLIQRGFELGDAVRCKATSEGF